MARLTQISDADACLDAASLFAAIKGKIGMVPNLYRVMANRPAALEGLLNLNAALGKGGFDARLREAVALAVAGANGCDYCASAHGAISKGLSVAENQIEAHLRGQSDDPRTAAVLALATEIVRTGGQLPDASLDQARAAGLSDGDIVETLANVVANIFTNYVNHVIDTESDFQLAEALFLQRRDEEANR